jgi:hypothetical protein
MNSFTFLTNNPAARRGDHVHLGPAHPTLSFARPTGAASPLGRPDVSRRRGICRTPGKHQWSFDVQRELFLGTALDLQYVGSNTSPPRPQLLQQHAAARPGCRRPRRPSQKFRSRRIIMNDLRRTTTP